MAQLQNETQVQKPLPPHEIESNRIKGVLVLIPPQLPLPLIPLHLGLSLSVILIPLPFLQKDKKKFAEAVQSLTASQGHTHTERERDGEDNTYGGVLHQTVALYVEVRRSFSPGPFPRFLRSSEEARLLTPR